MPIIATTIIKILAFGQISGGTKVNNGKIIGEYSSEGVRDGLIAIAVKGTNGYAYDSIFLDPKTRKSYGELSYGEKQRDSHRRRAFEGLVAVIG